LSVIVSACGGEAQDPGAPQTEEPDADAEQTMPADEDPASSDIEDVLLTVGDLPEGWKEVTGDDSGESASCLDRLTDPDGPFEPSSSVNRSFAEGPLGPFLLSVVTSSPADDVLVATDDVLTACDGHTTDAGFTASFEAIAIAGLPPDAIAVQGTEASDDGGSLRLVLAAAGTGSGTVFLLGLVPLGEVDEVLVGNAVDVMVDRLQ